MSTFYEDEDTGEQFPTRIETALAETDEIEKSKAIEWLRAQGVTDAASAQAFIEERGEDFVLKDGESFTEFAERYAEVLKSRGDAMCDEKEDEINDRLAGILKTAAEEINDDLQKDDADDLVEDILTDANAVLLKARGWIVGPRNVDPDFTRRLVETTETLREITPELPLVKQRDAASVLVEGFEQAIATIEKRDGLRKASPSKVVLASDGFEIHKSADELDFDAAAAEYVETGDAEPLLTEYQRQQDAKIASVEKAADEARDSFDHDHALDVLAEGIAKSRKIRVPDAHAWAFDNDETYRDLFKQRQLKAAKRDSSASRTNISEAEHEAALRKDRAGAKQTAYQVLIGKARQAGVDVEDKAALEAWFKTSEGAAARQQYAKFGSEVRRKTAMS